MHSVSANQIADIFTPCDNMYYSFLQSSVPLYYTPAIVLAFIFTSSISFSICMTLFARFVEILQMMTLFPGQYLVIGVNCISIFDACGNSGAIMAKKKNDHEEREEI